MNRRAFLGGALAGAAAGILPGPKAPSEGANGVYEVTEAGEPTVQKVLVTGCSDPDLNGVYFMYSTLAATMPGRTLLIEFSEKS